MTSWYSVFCTNGGLSTSVFVCFYLNIFRCKSYLDNVDDGPGGYSISCPFAIDQHGCKHNMNKSKPVHRLFFLLYKSVYKVPCGKGM